MKQRFIKKEGNSTLLLFFAGWGSDENLFAGPVQEGCDCLLCFDYKDLDFDYSLLEGYREIRVMAWSMGVCAISSKASPRRARATAMASVPAGDICSDISAAGIIISA